VTLLELLAVVTLLGIFASVAMMHFGRSLFADFGAQAAARQLSLALLQSQRAAIATGNNHYVAFDSSTPTSYRIFRRLDSGQTLVDGPHELSADVVAIVSHTSMEFTFEGQALAAYSLTLEGENRSWSMSVVPISGAVQVTEITP